MSQAQINIVGLGIQEGYQVTFEGLEIFKSSARIYYLGPHLDLLQELYAAQQFKIESIMHLYNNGEVDKVIYKRVFDFLINEARIHNNITLVVPGHPRVGVSVVGMLERNEHNIKIYTYPGISCIDTLINDLKIDPIEYGSMMVDVNRLLLYELPISKALDVYIFHVCSIGTSRVHFNNSQTSKVNLLKEHLLKFYHPETEVYLVSSAISKNASHENYAYQIKDLHNILEKTHFGTTLYIPGKRPETYNQEYLGELCKTL